MYKLHPNSIIPSNPQVKLWRYLDFTKFVSLIDKKAIFFVRSDKLEDEFEGISPKQEVGFLTKGVTGMPLDMFKESEEWSRKNMAISCWHMNDIESAAMWKVYLKSDEGVAIQTTFEKFTHSFHLHTDDEIWISRVKYGDYETLKFGNKLLYNFIHKRSFFNYEKEVRALVMRFPTEFLNTHPGTLTTKEVFAISGFGINAGVYVNVDLSVLIEKIIVSPICQSWFFELVESVAAKYGLSSKVERSVLSQKPY